MKNFLLLILALVFFFSNQIISQEISKKQFYESKIASYTKMKKTGNALAITGGVFTVGGIILVASADWTTSDYYDSNSSDVTTADPEGVAGVLMLCAGIPMTVTGIVLSSVGGRKVKEYRQKLENHSFKINYAPNKFGITYCFKF